MSFFPVEYPLISVRPIDGDTLIARIDLSARPETDIICRLLNVMAPEMGSKANMNWDGYLAKARLIEWLERKGLHNVKVELTSRDSYNRILTIVRAADGETLNDYLLRFPEIKPFKQRRR